MFATHNSVVAFTGALELSATLYDRNNNNLIFNLLPEYVLREDDAEDGLLTTFSLALARYFDHLKLYIDQFDKTKITNYQSYNQVPDLFLPSLTKYFGWKITEHFNDSNPLEFLFGEKVLASGSLEIPLHSIRNEFWRRILNNLPYLYATKGKKQNVESFFNVLGINRENFNIKEYGYLAGGSLSEERIHKEKSVSVLGITSSISSSYIKIPNVVSASRTQYTVESYVQLPHASSSFSSSLLTGSIWQLTDANQVTGSIALLWAIPTLRSVSGKFILTGSNGQSFETSDISVFNGDFVYVAAGLNKNQLPFIEIKTLDNDRIDFTGSFSGTTIFSQTFTGSKFDLIIGANSGSYHRQFTKGYFQEIRYWSRALSGSEMNSHALHFENVGIQDPLELPHPLIGHWPLKENMSSSAAGILTPIVDHSRNNLSGTGIGFAINNNPYKKFLLEYNYISPSVDLKWTENKIRIRNKSVLKKTEIAKDTNEVSLEFNLIDALNEDIMKIFSTFDNLHNVIGEPINKYRDEYSDLEGYRRRYFDRLGDSIHFNKFFNLFKWFDKKISDAIKQLLPARVRFIGGEQVVESHFLERPKYGFKYPIFKTPVDIPDAELENRLAFSGSNNLVLNCNNVFTPSSQEKLELERNYSIDSVSIITLKGDLLSK